jgi:predicted RNase H-like HicB family nuclease
MTYSASVIYSTKSMAQHNFNAVVWKEDDHYISQCLEVNVSSYGKTKKEALAMLQDALKLYFEDTPIPNNLNSVEHPSIESVTLQNA